MVGRVLEGKKTGWSPGRGSCLSLIPRGSPPTCGTHRIPCCVVVSACTRHLHRLHETPTLLRIDESRTHRCVTPLRMWVLRPPTGHPRVFMCVCACPHVHTSTVEEGGSGRDDPRSCMWTCGFLPPRRAQERWDLSPRSWRGLRESGRGQCRTSHVRDEPPGK